MDRNLFQRIEQAKENVGEGTAEDEEKDHKGGYGIIYTLRGPARSQRTAPTRNARVRGSV